MDGEGLFAVDIAIKGTRLEGQWKRKRRRRQEAQAARALDDDDPWSYFSSGYVECFLSKYDDAIAWYRRAIELNENFALAHGNMAAALAFGGQPDAAIEAVERSIRMSPRDPFNFSYLHFAGIAYFAAERYAEGVAYEEQALRERPNVSPALRCLAACHVGLGQIDKARSAIAEVLRGSGKFGQERRLWPGCLRSRE